MFMNKLFYPKLKRRLNSTLMIQSTYIKKLYLAQMHKIVIQRQVKKKQEKKKENKSSYFHISVPTIIS